MAESVQINCPECGHLVEKPLAEIVNGVCFACPACGVLIKIEGTCPTDISNLLDDVSPE